MESSEKRPVNRIAILGANGQIGQVVTDRLCQAYPHAHILPCIRNNKASSNNLNSNYFQFNPFKDDWKLLGKPDVLINCIGIIEATKDMSFEEAHIGLTQLILAHRERMGFPRIIQVSALGADTSHPHAFLQTKGKADKILLKEQNTIVVRPSIVCTPDTVFLQKLKMLRCISRRLLYILPFPGQVLHTKIQPILAEDVATIIAKLCIISHPPRLVNAVGPAAISLQEFIHLAEPETRIIAIPKPAFDFMFRITSPLLSSLINPAQYQLITSDNTADSTESECVLGSAPHTTTDFWINELNR